MREGLAAAASSFACMTKVFLLWGGWAMWNDGVGDLPILLPPFLCFPCSLHLLRPSHFNSLVVVGSINLGFFGSGGLSIIGQCGTFPGTRGWRSTIVTATVCCRNLGAGVRHCCWCCWVLVVVVVIDENVDATFVDELWHVISCCM